MKATLLSLMAANAQVDAVSAQTLSRFLFESPLFKRARKVVFS